ncbi:MAG: twin-arginine translocation signal domain-containing protein [Candidatus Rokubacteria bacterium]|nr:twin-arginine translocation signal domain-containing protein [Candidatus Rokubacteria bacterium]
MDLTRRDFLKGTGTGAGLAAAGAIPLPAEAYTPQLKTQGTREVPSICYYCAVGCGIKASVADGKVVAIQGDPEHPINRGALCSKAQAYIQVLDNPRRLQKALYRAPGATAWEEKPLDWAMDEIAKRVKATRDATFKESEDGVRVNRAEAIAALGSAIIANEECYLLVKLMRGLGVVWLEHQARI